MVRVAADSKTVQSGKWSLIAAGIVALIAVLTLSLMRAEPPQAAPQRSLVSYPVVWTCERDATHEFTANGRYDPMPCRHPGCGGMCSIHLVFACERHHQPFDVWVQFDRDANTGDADNDDVADEQVSAYRYVPSGPWIESKDGRVACPVDGCEGPTRPVRKRWSQGTPHSEPANGARGDSNND